MSNTLTFAEVLCKAEILGEQHGNGDTALPMLALFCAEQVRENGIKDIVVVKGKPNDVTRLYESYAKGRARTAPAEKAAKSLTSQVAKLQAIAKAAKKMDNFAADVMVRVERIRAEMVADTNGPKVWPLYDAYVGCAVEQNLDKNTTILTDDQIRARVRKDAKVKTLVEVIEGLRDTCFALVDPDGEISLPKHLDEMKEVLGHFAKMLAWAEREAMSDEERQEFDARKSGGDAAVEKLQAERKAAERKAIAEAAKVANAIRAEKAELKLAA